MTNGLNRAGLWLSRFDPLLIAAILAIVAVLAPRLVPNTSSDRGIYLTVAARLLAGDTLYVDVYDNKDPLFYYLIVGELALGRWSQVAVEVLFFAIAAFSSYFVAIKFASRWTALAVSAIAVPIILSGESYLPGYTELPGVALTLAAIAAAGCGRPTLAGLCIGVLAFTKLIYVPVALVGIGCFWLIDFRVSDLIKTAATASRRSSTPPRRSDDWESSSSSC